MSWQRNQRWNYWGTKPKVQQSQKATKSGKESQFPGYDHAGSSLPSSSSKLDGEVGMKQALQALMKTNRLEVPEELKSMIEEPLGEVREQQKHLNNKRRAIQKLDRLKQARVSKIKKWENFKSDLAKHLKAEQEKYDKDMESLKESINQAQIEVDRIESGMPPTEEEELDIDSMLEDSTEQELRRQLLIAHQEAEKQRKTMEQMQETLQAYAHALKNETPAPGGTMPEVSSPQGVKEPKTKEALAKEKEARRKRMEAVEAAKRNNESLRERSPRRESQDSQDVNALG